ncbi:bacteriocin-like protein [Chryseobacterium sp. Leaf405]|uniref:bacteriocin-like protein n=1 Tax=Chryseobacterium sp. Leaf405 TaxID=1736367 RepID=UPI000B12CAEA
MKNLKKLSRADLKSLQGGAVINPIDCCGSWCNGVYMPCRVHHFACPPDSDTAPPSDWDGNCPLG